LVSTKQSELYNSAVVITSYFTFSPTCYFIFAQCLYFMYDMYT